MQAFKRSGAGKRRSHFSKEKRPLVITDSPLRIGSFNLEKFGQTPHSRAADVSDILAKILTRYDLLFLMEPKTSSESNIDRLIKRLHTIDRCSPFDFEESQAHCRLHGFDEHYCFFYRMQKLSVVDVHCYGDQPFQTSDRRSDSLHKCNYSVSRETEDSSSETFCSTMVSSSIHVVNVAGFSSFGPSAQNIAVTHKSQVSTATEIMSKSNLPQIVDQQSVGVCGNETLPIEEFNTKSASDADIDDGFVPEIVIVSELGSLATDTLKDDSNDSDSRSKQDHDLPSTENSQAASYMDPWNTQMEDPEHAVLEGNFCSYSEFAQEDCSKGNEKPLADGQDAMLNNSSSDSLIPFEMYSDNTATAAAVPKEGNNSYSSEKGVWQSEDDDDCTQTNNYVQFDNVYFEMEAADRSLNGSAKPAFCRPVIHSFSELPVRKQEMSVNSPASLKPEADSRKSEECVGKLSLNKNQQNNPTRKESDEDDSISQASEESSEASLPDFKTGSDVSSEGRSMPSKSISFNKRTSIVEIPNRFQTKLLAAGVAPKPKRKICCCYISRSSSLGPKSEGRLKDEDTTENTAEGTSTAENKEEKKEVKESKGGSVNKKKQPSSQRRESKSNGKQVQKKVDTDDESDLDDEDDDNNNENSFWLHEISQDTARQISATIPCTEIQSRRTEENYSLERSLTQPFIVSEATILGPISPQHTLDNRPREQFRINSAKSGVDVQDFRSDYTKRIDYEKSPQKPVASNWRNCKQLHNGEMTEQYPVDTATLQKSVAQSQTLATGMKTLERKQNDAPVDVCCRDYGTTFCSRSHYLQRSKVPMIELNTGETVVETDTEMIKTKALNCSWGGKGDSKIQNNSWLRESQGMVLTGNHLDQRGKTLPPEKWIEETYGEALNDTWPDRLDSKVLNEKWLDNLSSKISPEECLGLQGKATYSSMTQKEDISPCRENYHLDDGSLRREHCHLEIGSHRQEHCHLDDGSLRREHCHLEIGSLRQEHCHLDDGSLRREHCHLEIGSLRREHCHLDDGSLRREHCHLEIGSLRREHCHLDDGSLCRKLCHFEDSNCCRGHCHLEVGSLCGKHCNLGDGSICQEHCHFGEGSLCREHCHFGDGSLCREHCHLEIGHSTRPTKFKEHALVYKASVHSKIASSFGGCEYPQQKVYCGKYKAPEEVYLRMEEGGEKRRRTRKHKEDRNKITVQEKSVFSICKRNQENVYTTNHEANTQHKHSRRFWASLEKTERPSWTVNTSLWRQEKGMEHASSLPLPESQDHFNSSKVIIPSLDADTIDPSVCNQNHNLNADTESRKSTRSVSADPDNLEQLEMVFCREAFAVLFLTPLSELPQFVVLAIHTDPRDAFLEIQAIQHLYDITCNRWATNDILLMGDFVMDENQRNLAYWRAIQIKSDRRFTQLGQTMRTLNLPSAKERNFDRFVIAGSHLNDALDASCVGLYHFDKVLKLTSQQAAEVSDHFPIELQLTGQSKIRHQELCHTKVGIIIEQIRPVSTLPRLRAMCKVSKAKPAGGFETNVIYSGPYRKRKEVRAIKKNVRDVVECLKSFQQAFPDIMDDITISVAASIVGGSWMETSSKSTLYEITVAVDLQEPHLCHLHIFRQLADSLTTLDSKNIFK